jgi:hypothetical protein
MTWKQLRDYIELQSKQNSSFLDKEVCVYNYDDGEEHVADIIELLEEKEEEEHSGWVSYLTINEEEVENGKTKETSVS